MSTSLANFLFEAVNFLLLAGALGYLFFKPVRAALDRELDARNADEAERARLRAEAEELNRKAHDAWAATDAELEQHRTELLAEARAEVSSLKEKARQDRGAEREALGRELRAARESDTQELAANLGQVAGAAVAQLLKQVEGPDLDTALVRAACAELPAAGSPGAAAVVESARPLLPQARSLLQAALGESYTERLVPDLGAGVRITTPSGLVDASAAAFARRAAAEVTALGAEPTKPDTDG